MIYGDIPTEIGELVNLEMMYLWSNQLTGSVPDSVGILNPVKWLWFQGSNAPRVSSYMPEEIFTFPSLSKFLDLSSNSLIGFLPSKISGLQHLVLLNLSKNMLSGTILESFDSFISLRELYMFNNFFLGNLSPMSSMNSLEITCISHNNITGNQGFKNLLKTFLRNLNLSYNDLTGEVPIEGVFKNSSQVSVDGTVSFVEEFQIYSSHYAP
ncbi:unnamed protein product [Fraxinus pennsylvanica]|uniref:Non-specific serine/threonine protein kinase n=1 Tax=Fraxinus pennsylvanica TaxID=56036 RepID=A0AAD2AB33_9LAMI|nr:unnamed protein product [Fraxinus pennsylvanica]